MELIARKNAFVELQKYDEVKKQVVSATEPPEFEPIRIVDFNYEDGVLMLKLSQKVQPKWEEEFRDQRGGHEYIAGYGPSEFNIYGDVAMIEMPYRVSLIQQVVDNAKEYVKKANHFYVQQLREDAKKIDEMRRAALKKKIAEAEIRKNIRSRVKL